MFWTSKIKLNPIMCDHMGLYCPYSRHKLVWQHFSADKRKFLFDSDYDVKGKHGEISIVSYVPPNKPKELVTRKLPKEFFENKFAKFRIRFATPECEDILRAERMFVEEVNRAGASYCIINDVSDCQYVKYFKTKYNRHIQYNYYIFDGEIDLNYKFIYYAYKYGFGFNKSDGFGLMMLEPISVENIIKNSLDNEEEMVI
jgi:hypothetical protein